MRLSRAVASGALMYYLAVAYCTEAPPLRLCMDVGESSNFILPIQMSLAMLLAVDHVQSGNCTILPGGTCDAALVPTAGGIAVEVSLYNSELQPALGLQNAYNCNQTRGHVYVLGGTDDNVQILSPVNSANGIVTATPLSVEHILRDDLFHRHLIRLRQGTSEDVKQIAQFIELMGWRQIAILYSEDFSGLSYGLQLEGLVIKKGIDVSAYLLDSSIAETSRKSLAELKDRGVKVIFSLVAGPGQYEKIQPIADELGLLGSEYTWLGPMSAGRPDSRIDGRETWPLPYGALVFTHAPKVQAEAVEALQLAMKQRGADDMLELFEFKRNDTVQRALEMLAVHDAVFHAYDLVWFLAKGHTKVNSLSASDANNSDSYADRFVSAVTSDSFEMNGITNSVKLNDQRERQATRGLYEFRIYQVTNTSGIEMVGKLDSDGTSFILEGGTTLQWRDGSYYPSVPSDGLGVESSERTTVYILTAVAGVLALGIVALLLRYRRVSNKLHAMEEDDLGTMGFHTPVTEAAFVLKAMGNSYWIGPKLRQRAWAAGHKLLVARDLHVPVIQEERLNMDAIPSGVGRAMMDAARNVIGQFTAGGSDDLHPVIDKSATGSNARSSISGSGRGGSARGEELVEFGSFFAKAQESRPDLMAQLGTELSFNSFALDAVCDKQPLLMATMMSIRNLGLVTSLQLDESKLVAYIGHIEMGYEKEVPYHNNIHAADVVNRVVAIIRADELFMDGSFASRCILLSVVIAAAVHDYRHQGFNNDYEVAFDTHVSRQFNEQAVLENYSIYHALSLIRDDARLNFMDKMTKAVQRSIISRIINLVLATDMKRHFSILAEFKSQIVQKVLTSTSAHKNSSKRDVTRGRRVRRISSTVGSRVVEAITLSGRNVLESKDKSPSADGLPSSAVISQRPPIDFESLSEGEKTMVLSLALKVSDIGHAFLPWELHQQWSTRLQTEFFDQGRCYIDGGMKPPILMDPAKPGVSDPVNQCAFFKIIAAPLLNAWGEVFRNSAAHLQANMHINVSNWHQMAGGSTVVSMAELSPPSKPPAARSTPSSATTLPTGAQLQREAGIMEEDDDPLLASRPDHRLPPLPGARS